MTLEKLKPRRHPWRLSALRSSRTSACRFRAYEFQSFSTDAFASLLSEARKFALHFCLGNQYTSQLSTEVREAVFGNAGSMIVFRVGGKDADLEFKPERRHNSPTAALASRSLTGEFKQGARRHRPLRGDLAIPHGEFELATDEKSHNRSLPTSRSLMGSSNIAAHDAIELTNSRSLMGSSNLVTLRPKAIGSLAIPHGEFEHERRGREQGGPDLAIPHGEFELGADWDLKSPEETRDPSWGVRTGHLAPKTAESLAIPHGEFEHGSVVADTRG